MDFLTVLQSTSLSHKFGSFSSQEAAIMQYMDKVPIPTLGYLYSTYYIYELSKRKKTMQNEHNPPNGLESSLKCGICRMFPLYEYVRKSSLNVPSPSLSSLWITINVFTATCNQEMGRDPVMSVLHKMPQNVQFSEAIHLSRSENET